MAGLCRSERYYGTHAKRRVYSSLVECLFAGKAAGAVYRVHGARERFATWFALTSMFTCQDVNQ